MNLIGKELTDQCMITTTRGAIVTGAEDVGKLIEECCVIYNRAYMRTMYKYIGCGIIIGVVWSVTELGVKKLIKSKKLKTKELKSEDEA